jgi:glycosyltransferase involved in cell wall biosynthesis
VPEAQPRVRIVAFYLPQFHPSPENDAWWGPGFTEWTNAARARPTFPGHQQPHLPAELGFYDLRSSSVRQRQAELASEHGVHAFCYYYYWFDGRKLLDEPLAAVLRTGEPDFPFCLCWANENWTRSWDGKDDDVLVAQRHTPASDARFITEVLPILLDRRYLRLEGKPVLLVYRADLLADPLATTSTWRRCAREAGLPGLHLCAVWKVDDPGPLGFDALVEFPPHHFPHHFITAGVPGLPAGFEGEVLDYAAGVHAIEPLPDAPRVHRGVMPRWDNTARRRGAAWIYHGSTPALYQQWLEQVLVESLARPGEQLVFINAWNEWAEGAFLEPSLQDGEVYLEATREALATALRCAKAPEDNASAVATGARSERHRILVVAHDAARAGSQLYLLQLMRELASRPDLELQLWLFDGGELESSFAELAVITHLTQTSRGVVPAATIKKALDSLDPLPDMALCNTALTHQAARTCAGRGIPVLAIVHELPTTIDATVGAKAITDLVACCRRLVVVSEFVADALARRYDVSREQLTVIPTGHPPPASNNTVPSAASRIDTRSRLGVPDEAFLVLGCGSLHHRKGPDLFVQVAQLALRRLEGERLYFVWVGGPEPGAAFLEWCEHDIAAAGLDGHVRFIGHTDDVTSYYEAADAFLLPSREDPFPLVNLEALARGLPVVAFEGAGGAPEALHDGAGIVVPYLDVAAMARELVCLAEAPRHRDAIRERALAAYRQRYQWSTFIDTFFAMLERDFGIPKAAQETVDRRQ